MAPNMIQLIKRSNFNSSELIDLLASHNTLLKKITCDYLVDKSSIDSNLSLLTANILLRDCNDANPAIRSSSLLALSSLPDMEDAAISSVAKAMTDPAPQVRRAAPFGCINLHKHAPEVFISCGLVDSLYEGIKDSDPVVIVNCLLSLEAVLREEGGLVVNRSIAHHLLGRLAQFSEGDVVYVLNLLMKYSPKKEEEIFDMLNQLDFCLKSSSPSLLMTATQLFIHLTKDYSHLTGDLYDVVNNPFCKILSQNRPELCYFSLNFLQGFSEEFQKSFSNEFKFFLVKSKDPLYLRDKKFEVLPVLATKENVSEMISEVKHYISDFQSFKSAFRCLAVLGSFDKEAEVEVLNILTHVISRSTDVVVVAALSCLLYIISKSYDQAGEEISATCTLNLPEDLCGSVSRAIVRPGIQENNLEIVLRTFQFFAPFLEDVVQDFLEELIKQMDSFDLGDRCLFVTSVCIAFLHWPSVVQPLLTSVLGKAFKSPDRELVNHAAFVYAALEEGPLNAFKLLSVATYFPLLDIVGEDT